MGVFPITMKDFNIFSFTLPLEMGNIVPFKESLQLESFTERNKFFGVIPFFRTILIKAMILKKKKKKNDSEKKRNESKKKGTNQIKKGMILGIKESF